MKWKGGGHSYFRPIHVFNTTRVLVLNTDNKQLSLTMPGKNTIIIPNKANSMLGNIKYNFYFDIASQESSFNLRQFVPNFNPPNISGTRSWNAVPKWNVIYFFHSIPQPNPTKWSWIAAPVIFFPANLPRDTHTYMVTKDEQKFLFLFCSLNRSRLVEHISDIEGVAKVKTENHVTATEPSSFQAP